jgi:hypothetical protein
MSLLTTGEAHWAESVRDTAGRMLNEELASFEPIGGGRNSQVYRLVTEGGGQYALKAYFRHGADPRDRLGTELDGLRFLWNNGVRDVPRPVMGDRQQGVAIYEYIEGERASTGPASEHDMDAAVRFLARLKDLKEQPGSRTLSPASEACFSIGSITSNIHGRLARLTDVQSTAAPCNGLAAFLRNELIPGLAAVVDWCRTRSSQARISFDDELEPAGRTLSPSDFGLHNALRRSDGRLVFVDFEYFGWDDPAKMVADVLLHPAMDLCSGLKRRFVDGILHHFREYPHLPHRMEIVYPLFGIKWCLIMLNEFLPEHLSRRRFAHEGAKAETFQQQAVQMEQLIKAKSLWQKIRDEYENFPYIG